MDHKIDAAIHDAIACLAAGRADDALIRLGAVRTADEASPIKSNLIGLIYLSARDDAMALSWFDRALHLDCACSAAWFNRGTALHQLGRPDALASYDEALRLGLSEPALFYNRGNLLRESGRLEEAIASYDAALKHNPAYPEALRAGALVLRNLGRHESALEFFDEALRCVQTSPRP